jgi:tetratricopeptide (TPR) repeat protein
LTGLFSHPKRRLRKLVLEGEYREALEFGKKLEKNSNDADLFFIIGGIYYLLGDAKNTLFYIDKSIEINEKDSEVFVMKARMHIYQKDKKTALECIDKIRDLDPKNENLQELLDGLEELSNS